MNYINKHQVYSRCILGLGSNLDNPFEQIKLSIKKINEEKAIEIIAKSKLYLSKPHGSVKQPDYTNSAILIDTQLSPHNLLAAMNNIAKEQNKYSKIHWGPRNIDIDILIYIDNRIINDDKLQIPHPEILNRDFVLLPIADLIPNIILPNKMTVNECLAICQNKFVYEQIATDY